jgi:large subunit ribosomal protein L31e
MAEEKIFTIPLRDAFDKPRTMRAKIAIEIIRGFIRKHMDSEDIKIGNSINKHVFSRGQQKIPRNVRIHAIKQENIVYAELVGTEIKPISKKELEAKEKKKKAKEEKIKEERKERRKKSIQEEIKEESGKAPQLVAEGKEAVKEETKEKTLEDKDKKEEKIEERV